MIVDGTGAAFPPLLLKLLFDEGILKRDFSTFLTVALLFAGISILLYLAGLHIRLLTQALANRIVRDRVLQAVEGYYRLPYTHILEKDSSYFLSRTYEEVRGAIFATMDALLGLSTVWVRLLAAAAVAFALSPMVALVGLLAVPGLYGASRRFAAPVFSQSKEEREREARLRTSLVHSLAAHPWVQTFHWTPKVLAHLANRIDRFTTVLYRRVRSATLYQKSGEMILSIFQAVILILAGYEVFVGELSFGGFLAFSQVFTTLTCSLLELFRRWPGILKLLATVERVHEFLQLFQRALQERGQGPIRYGDGIELENVHFSYDSKVVLEGFSFTIAKGERILIVGANGSGKSTLARLLAGWLSPQEGWVKTFPPERISALIEPVALPPLPLVELLPEGAGEEAQRLAQALGLTASYLAKTYEELSAGEKKKAGVLLTLLKEADCYIFDEPLAHVDEESKEPLIEAVLERTQGKTLIVILHGDLRFHELFPRVLTLSSTGRLQDRRRMDSALEGAEDARRRTLVPQSTV
jgi:ATP-binding cassette subfamily B protein